MTAGRNDPTNPWGSENSATLPEETDQTKALGTTAHTMTSMADAFFKNPPRSVRIIGGSGSSGYLGTSNLSMTPMLLVDEPNAVNPITDTNTSKFGTPTSRPTKESDLTVSEITLSTNGEFTNKASTNYAEFSRIKLDSVIGDYSELMSILYGGIYI